jgi:murein DD-endopeptidase MepM/ murein hydrolase activator NlpD
MRSFPKLFLVLVFTASFAACVLTKSNGNMEVSSSPKPQQTPLILPPPLPPLKSSPLPKPSPFASPENQTVSSLMIPVVGVKAKDLRDTFDEARSENRVHDAIDIMAAIGTPVVAAIDGKIIKFFDSEKGGITIYQLGTDERTVYYYAHLQRRAENLREGDSVKQGTLIGYVGDTGNAGTGNFHLHFAIWTIADPKNFYNGVNQNPYPLLKNAPEAKIINR